MGVSAYSGSHKNIGSTVLRNANIYLDRNMWSEPGNLAMPHDSTRARARDLVPSPVSPHKHWCMQVIQGVKMGGHIQEYSELNVPTRAKLGGVASAAVQACCLPSSRLLPCPQAKLNKSVLAEAVKLRMHRKVYQ